MGTKQKIGVLSVQGAFSKHYEILKRLDQNVYLVNNTDTLDLVDKLIIPGGESTTMRILLKKHNLWQSLIKFCINKPTFGTCAGAILLSRDIDDHQDSLSAIDISIARNSYGRQVDSFVTEVMFEQYDKIKIQANFIRAPIITRVGGNVKVLSTLSEHAVIVQENHHLACTFHPELTNDLTVHKYFIDI